jgi:hypothetical protein
MNRLITLFFLLLVCAYSMAQDIYLFVESPAEFQDNDLNYFLNNYVIPKLLIPDSIKNSCKYEYIWIRFDIDSSAKVSNVNILRSYNKLLDDQVLTIIKSSSGLWHSATQSGRKVSQRFQFAVPISKIEKDCPEYTLLVDQSNKQYLNGNYAESVRLSNKLLAIDPKNNDVLILRAKCKIKLQEYSSACNDLNVIYSDEAKILKEQLKCK